MFIPIQAQCVFHLLQPSKPIPSVQDSAKTAKMSVDFDSVVDVALGEYEEKLQQLEELSRLLWVNGSARVDDFSHYW